MNQTNKTFRRRELMKRGIAFLTGIATGSLVTEVYHKSFPQSTTSLQDITQRSVSLKYLINKVPYPPNTQWLHLIVEPGYKTELSYLELARWEDDRLKLPSKLYNSLGLPMDEDVPFEKPEGEFRIIVYGDSNTEGMCENKDSFPSQLERLLHERGQRNVRVINAGISASGPLELVLRHEHIGTLLSPDMIIFAFSMGNDLLDLVSEKKYFLSPTAGGYAEVWPKINRNLFGVTESSQRILISNQPFQTKSIEFPPSLLETLESHKKLLNNYQFGASIQGYRQLLLAHLSPTIFDEAAQRFRYCLWKLAQSKPKNLKMVLLPSPFSVMPPGLLERFKTIGDIHKTLGDFSHIDQEIPKIFVHSITGCLDISEENIICPIKGLNGRNVLLYQDLHYSPKGNAIIAEEITNRIITDLR